MFHLIRCIAVLIVSGLFSSVVFAGWGNSQENIAGKPTWLYTPDSGMGNPNLLAGKRALAINLHGCDQNATELKEYGNWGPTAEEYGLVVAVPDVVNGFLAGCWNYDGTGDGSGHMQSVINIVNDLLARQELNLDADQVYVYGLSSGGALALKLGCWAPDVFAGVGAVAGPSVGSSQILEALSNAPGNNVSRGITACTNLAGSKSGFLDTQVTSLAYGEMDKNGPIPAPLIYGQGERPLVDVNWTYDNAVILGSMYNSGALSSPVNIQNGLGSEQLSTRSGDTVLSMVRVFNMAHAWPSGQGGNPSLAEGGQWIYKLGFDYAKHATEFFFAKNLRVDTGPVNLPPVINSFNASVSGASIIVTGNATDADGSVDSVALDLNGTQSSSVVLLVNANGDFSTSFDNLPDGIYAVTASATDNEGQGGNLESISGLIVGEPINTPPELTLVGASSITLNVGDTYVDPGATAIDAEDGDLTSQISTICDVDTSTAGSYSCTYSVVDSGELSDSEVRTILVEENECTEYTDNNFGHVAAGRAVVSWVFPTFGQTFAVGSGDPLGAYFLFYSSTMVSETAPGFFNAGSCP